MPETQIQWMVDKHVVRITAYEWNGQGLADDILKVNGMVNQSDLPLVHTLWDFRNLDKYPTNLNDIRKGIQPLFTNEKCGWVITVMQNPMIGFLAQAGSSMFGVRYRTFKKMTDALDFIQNQDPTLPPLS